MPIIASGSAGGALTTLGAGGASPVPSSAGSAACGVGCGPPADDTPVMSYVGTGAGEYIQETTYKYVGSGAGEFNVTVTNKKP